MSHFGTTLLALIESNKISAGEVARRSGFDPSLISKWINDSQNPSAEATVKIAMAAAKSKSQKAKLIVAYLRDNFRGQGADLIRISIGGKRHKSLMPEGDIEYLATASASDPVLRELLSKLAEMHRR